MIDGSRSESDAINGIICAAFVIHPQALRPHSCKPTERTLRTRSKTSVAETTWRKEREWTAAFYLESDHSQDLWERKARWLKASRALKKNDQIYGQKLAKMAKKHSS